MDPGWNFLTRVAPVGRAVKEGGTVTDIFSGLFGDGSIDPNRTGLESFIKFFTGVKYAPKGKREELWAMEQYITRLLRQYETQGKAGEIPLFFPIGDGADTLPQQMMIDNLKKLSKMKKRLAEQRRGTLSE